MRILLDTNIILDILQKREPWFVNSYAVFERCIRQEYIGFITSHSLSDLFFVLRKSHSAENRRNAVKLICSYFKIVAENRDSFLAAVGNEYSDDLEDCLQIVAAQNQKLDFIITRNINDFKKSPVAVITPQELLLK